MADRGVGADGDLLQKDVGSGRYAPAVQLVSATGSALGGMPTGPIGPAGGIQVEGLAGAQAVPVSIAATVATQAVRSATGAQTSVTSANSDTTILASNANRLGATVWNDSTAVLYLLLANATSSTTVYTAQLAAQGYYEVPFGYTGVLKGIWASAQGAARVTELT